ncbi:formylglycine-generating enzyme family protein [Chloracidobacterium thermophilum]|uniref:formylglycine-generating enzyme family protein n=1 Tax=Chloracidobacterium thermophilum TaxID=458033 RepID=UPI0007389ABC|nr:formylglycine-generating enzyme family protein [Chloracidobacterium thermophilum]
MRSVGPDDPGRTNVSLPSLEMQPESAPPPGPAPDNGHHGDGFILGDISSPNLQLDALPPGATAGPESLPDLFATNISTPQFPPTLISPPPPSASSPLPPPAGGFSVPDPLATKTGTPAASPPTPPTLVPPPPAGSFPASGPLTNRTGTPAGGTPAVTPPTPPLNPTPPGGVPLPPDVAATPFRPVEPLVGAPRPMGRQITEMPVLPPKPPADLFAQTAPAAAPPRRTGFPLWLVVGLSVGAIVVLIGIVAAIAYFQWAAPSVPVASDTPADTPATRGEPPTQTESPVTPPKPVIPENMIAIPGGEYLIGRNSGDFLDPYEKPQHTVTLRPFYIDRTEVTNADYQKFIKATGHPAPAYWVGGQFEPGKELFPVTGVTLSDAEAYARWAGKRLPTEEEWEAAAHGRTPTIFPWGNAFDPSRANVKASGLGVPVRVGTYPAGASPFGVLDMTGNVWEWTASEARLYPGSTEKPPSWDKPLNPGTRLQIIRGGAFTEDTRRCTVTYRNWVPSDFKARELGFRCAQDQPPQ